MADSIDLLQQRIGNDRGNWAWGKLHTYTWQTEGSKLSKHLGSAAHTVLGWFDGYFNYGPYPAGGDHTTLNVSSYRIGENFDAWLVPAMRIIVDFSRDEPMQAVNSSGQSSNPSSPHYSDGNDWWYQHRYQTFPFKPENVDKQYQNPVRLVPGK
jgi:acyl-homoserine-lactone acylase